MLGKILSVKSSVVLELEDKETPYFTEQHQSGWLLLRKTLAKEKWFQFQAGRNEFEDRKYLDPAMNGRGFSGHVVVFRLLGFGATEKEALAMARQRI